MIKIISLIVICTELFKSTNGGYFEITKIVTPILNRQGKLAYLCEFDTRVQCFWKNNSRNLNLKPFEYQDKNIKNTTTCTILALNMTPGKGFILRYPQLQCIGYAQTADELQRVTIGGSIKLECLLPKANRCCWKHSTQTVLISHRYQYANALAEREKVTNCSLIISGITSTDDGLWECSGKIFNSATATVDTVISHKLVFADSIANKTRIPKSDLKQVDSSRLLTETQVSTRTVLKATISVGMPIENTTMAMPSKITTAKQFEGYTEEVVSPQKFHEMELKIVILLSALGVIFIVVVTGLVVYFVKNQKNKLQNLQKRSEDSPCDRIVNDLYTVSDNRFLRVSGIPNNHERLYSESGSETYLVPIKLNSDNDRRIYDIDQHIYEEIPELVNSIRSQQISMGYNDLQRQSLDIQSKPLPIPTNYNLDVQQQSSTSGTKVTNCTSAD